MHLPLETQDAMPLPKTPAACRERLLVLQDEIAAIRIQIATSDIRRQTAKKAPDPTAYHRAKTALRRKQQERARIQAHLATVEPRHLADPRERFKDALIEVLRAECDEERWASLLGRARALLTAREDAHG